MKYALIIGTDTYLHSDFPTLAAPVKDVEELSQVLGDPAIGGFNVQPLINASEDKVTRTIERFFRNRQRDDLLLLHFSGHGVLDINGRLHLAVTDSNLDELNSSSIPARFVSEQMDATKSSRVILMLDCCHSGSFVEGTRAVGTSVGSQRAFEGNGYGRWVLTATDETQFAWEGERLAGVLQPSIFTRSIVEGLKTGKADMDRDGFISVRDLADYVSKSVATTGKPQTVCLWSYKEQAKLIIAENPAPQLPEELVSALGNSFPKVRLAAVRELGGLLRSAPNTRLAGTVRAELSKIASVDDSKQVATAAWQEIGSEAEIFTSWGTAAEPPQLDEDRRRAAEQAHLEEERKQAVEDARQEEIRKLAAEQSRQQEERDRHAASEKTRMERAVADAAAEAERQRQQRVEREAAEAAAEAERQRQQRAEREAAEAAAEAERQRQQRVEREAAEAAAEAERQRQQRAEREAAEAAAEAERQRQQRAEREAAEAAAEAERQRQQRAEREAAEAAAEAERQRQQRAEREAAEAAAEAERQRQQRAEREAQNHRVEGALVEASDKDYVGSSEENPDVHHPTNHGENRLGGVPEWREIESDFVKEIDNQPSTSLQWTSLTHLTLSKKRLLVSALCGLLVLSFALYWILPARRTKREPNLIGKRDTPPSAVTPKLGSPENRIVSEKGGTSAPPPPLNTQTTPAKAGTKPADRNDRLTAPPSSTQGMSRSNPTSAATSPPAIVQQKNLAISSDEGTWTPQQVIIPRDYHLPSAVTFLTSKLGWVVGDRTILHTTNGGKTWAKQYPPIEAKLNAVKFVSQDLGWAVGRYGVIIHTKNGGRTWNTQTSGRSGIFDELSSVDFVTPLEGWVVGAYGIILHTEDGGTTWTKQTSGVGLQITYVSFLTPLLGWALCGNQVLHTEDGGSTWHKQWTGEVPLGSVVFTTPQSGWVTGFGNHDGGVIMHTADGGTTWKVSYTGSSCGFFISLMFTDPRTGLAVQGNGCILRTQDEGRTWVKLMTPDQNTWWSFASATSVSSQSAWAIGFLNNSDIRSLVWHWARRADE